MPSRSVRTVKSAVSVKTTACLRKSGESLAVEGGRPLGGRQARWRRWRRHAFRSRGAVHREGPQGWNLTSRLARRPLALDVGRVGEQAVGALSAESGPEVERPGWNPSLRDLGDQGVLRGASTCTRLLASRGPHEALRGPRKVCVWPSTVWLHALGSTFRPTSSSPVSDGWPRCRGQVTRSWARSGTRRRRTRTERAGCFRPRRTPSAAWPPGPAGDRPRARMTRRRGRRGRRVEATPGRFMAVGTESSPFVARQTQRPRMSVFRV